MNIIPSLTPFQQQAAAISLNKVLFGSYFSITALKEFAAFIGVEIGGKDLAAVSGLHCVNWCDMPADFRKEMRATILSMLGLDFTLEEVEDVMKPEPEVVKVVVPQRDFHHSYMTDKTKKPGLLSWFKK